MIRSRGPGIALRLALAALLVAGLVLCTVVVEPVGAVLYVSYAGVGSYVALRRPANVIGWLLVVAGWGFAGGMVRVFGLEPDGTTTGLPGSITVWLNGCGWAIAATALFTITVVFPSGLLPGGPGRWLARLTIGAAVVLAALGGAGADDRRLTGGERPRGRAHEREVMELVRRGLNNTEFRAAWASAARQWRGSSPTPCASSKWTPGVSWRSSSRDRGLWVATRGRLPHGDDRPASWRRRRATDAAAAHNGGRGLVRAATGG